MLRRVASTSAISLSYSQGHRIDLPSVHRQSWRENNHPKAPQKAFPVGQIRRPSSGEVAPRIASARRSFSTAPARLWNTVN